MLKNESLCEFNMMLEDGSTDWRLPFDAVRGEEMIERDVRKERYRFVQENTLLQPLQTIDKTTRCLVHNAIGILGALRLRQFPERGSNTDDT